MVSPVDGGLCGLRAKLGAQVGLLLDLRDGAWHPSSTYSYKPSFLRRGLLPLPPPTGDGPPAFLAAGAFGNARVATLDARGRVLRYGEGRGEVIAASMCPSDGHLLELVSRGDALVLAIRQIPSLRLVAEREIVTTDWVLDVFCASPDGSDVLVVVYVQRNGQDETRLLRVTPIGTAVLERDRTLSATMQGQTVFVSRGNGDLAVRNLQTGRRSIVTNTRRPLSGMSASTDLRHLSGFTSNKLVVVDLATGRTRSRPQFVGWRPTTHWQASNRLVTSSAGQIERHGLTPSTTQGTHPLDWSGDGSLGALSSWGGSHGSAPLRQGVGLCRPEATLQPRDRGSLDASARRRQTRV